MSGLQQLQLEWMGGPSERRLRFRRPQFDALPWESFRVEDVLPDDPHLLEARAVWTNGVFTEYASAAAFSAMNLVFLQCGAPVDLCAAAADFAVDELTHVALVSRLVMQLGGAVPYLADLSNVAPRMDGATALLAAAELCIKVSCVGEALSLPSLTASHLGAKHPLTQAVLGRLRHDEGPHAAIGYWFLEWADSKLTTGDREYLANVATDAIAVYRPLWRDGAASERFIQGRNGRVHYSEYMESVVDQRICRPLRKMGISVQDSANVHSHPSRG